MSKWPCTEHRPVEMAASDTGETIGWVCGDCGTGAVNAAAFTGRTATGFVMRIPIEPIPSRSIAGEVEDGGRAQLT